MSNAFASGTNESANPNRPDGVGAALSCNFIARSTRLLIRRYGIYNTLPETFGSVQNKLSLPLSKAILATNRQTGMIRLTLQVQQKTLAKAERVLNNQTHQAASPRNPIP